jgi:molybdate transport system substrate-binding protein
MLPGNRSFALAVAVLITCTSLAARAQARPRAPLTVYAASSLTNVFPKIDASQRYSFGGSNMLAAQIQHGAPADVFAAANMKLPNQLHAKEQCSKPVVFTRNTLVIVVPKANPAHIHGIHDLTRPGVKLVVADAGVPVGDFTLQILKNLKISAAVQKNVVSRETDVREVLAKVALGEADAGFVYATDAKTTPGRVTAINVPARAQPNVQYGICVVTSSGHKSQARAFVNTVLSKAAQAKLVAAGFLPRVKKK